MISAVAYLQVWRAHCRRHQRHRAAARPEEVVPAAVEAEVVAAAGEKALSFRAEGEESEQSATKKHL